MRVGTVFPIFDIRKPNDIDIIKVKILNGGFTLAASTGLPPKLNG
jgi:hypothetical protein